MAPLRGVVEKAAAASGRVIFLGSRSQRDLPGIVAGSIASLIVKDHPAHAASGLSPLKLYESMAAGVPVVVSALPGLEDTVELLTTAASSSSPVMQERRARLHGRWPTLKSGPDCCKYTPRRPRSPRQSSPGLMGLRVPPRRRRASSSEPSGVVADARRDYARRCATPRTLRARPPARGSRTSTAIASSGASSATRRSRPTGQPPRDTRR